MADAWCPDWTNQILVRIYILITFFFVLALKERKIGRHKGPPSFIRRLIGLPAVDGTQSKTQISTFETAQCGLCHVDHVIDCIVKSARVYWWLSVLFSNSDATMFDQYSCAIRVICELHISVNSPNVSICSEIIYDVNLLAWKCRLNLYGSVVLL